MIDIISFVQKMNNIIDNDKQFIKRRSDCNKLDIRNTLYASILH